ncbi:MAG: transposase [Deltaproteobacteria bacterium]|nr:transposase [Deltaproteobacteria bacterium]
MLRRYTIVNARGIRSRHEQFFGLRHGFFDQHMFHPWLVFDALSGQLITALLRPGRAHAAKDATTILTRLIRGIRQRCPNASHSRCPACSRSSSGSTRSWVISST